MTDHIDTYNESSDGQASSVTSLRISNDHPVPRGVSFESWVAKESQVASSSLDDIPYSFYPTTPLRPKPETKRFSSSSSAVSPQFMAKKKASDSDNVTLTMPYVKHLQNIGEFIERRLRSNENWHQQEMQRFWEEQRQDIADLEYVILNKLSLIDSKNQASDATTSASDMPASLSEQKLAQEAEALRKQQLELESRISELKREQTVLQRQLFEMDLVKAHNAELEKRCEMMRQRTQDLEADQERRQRHLESKIQALETQIVQLKKKPSGWAEMVEEDLAFSDRYHELETRYRQMEADLTNRLGRLTLDNARLQQTGRRTNVSKRTVPRPVSAVPTDTTYSLNVSSTSPTVSIDSKAQNRRTYYSNNNGELTFTTEINGRLSQYTIKLPSSHTSRSTYSPKSTPLNSHLNPNAPPWNNKVS